MPQPNQIDKKHPEYQASAADLLKVPAGDITEAGLTQNIAVGLGYLESWIRGIGCVPLFNLMEDAATAEISRAQLWQWIHHGCPPEGRPQDRPQALRLHPERRAAESQSLGSAQALRRLSESREADAGAIRFAYLHRVPDDSGLWLDPADGARRERDGDGGVAVYREFRLLRMAMQGAPCPAPLLGLRHGASSCSGRAREQSSPE